MGFTPPPPPPPSFNVWALYIYCCYFTDTQMLWSPQSAVVSGAYVVKRPKITCFLRAILNKRYLQMMDCIFYFAVVQWIRCSQAAAASRAQGIIHGMRSCQAAWVMASWQHVSRLLSTLLDIQSATSMTNRKKHAQKDTQRETCEICSERWSPEFISWKALPCDHGQKWGLIARPFYAAITSRNEFLYLWSPFFYFEFELNSALEFRSLGFWFWCVHRKEKRCQQGQLKFWPAHVHSQDKCRQSSNYDLYGFNAV